jgi:hypothetical protein
MMRMLGQDDGHPGNERWPIVFRALMGPLEHDTYEGTSKRHVATASSSTRRRRLRGSGRPGVDGNCRWRIELSAV